MQILSPSDLTKRNGIAFFQAALFEATGRLVHAFSTRQGGISLPPFDSLNLGFNSGDTREHVLKNRATLAETFGFPLSALLTVHQVHGENIFIIESPLQPDLPKPRCDAIITNTPGLAIGVLTADCVPMLLFDAENATIAAVHAGWKGTASNLVGKTVRTLRDRFGTQPENLLAAIGPSIGECCYEVDEPVTSAFSRVHPLWRQWARPSPDGHWMLDLARANVDLLEGAGVRRENMAWVNACTGCRGDLLYSHRRDKGGTGRQISFVMLR